MKARAVVVIPARYAATRLPGKPLIPLAGKPMIQWVYERAKLIDGVSEVIVATDDERIRSAVGNFGGSAMMTPADCANGSERVGMVARQVEADIIINLQGDEPLISPEAVGNALKMMQKHPEILVSTLGYPLDNAEDWQNPSVVKVITNRHMDAIYFSRTTIPYPREGSFQPLPLLFRHIGVYLYRDIFLQQFLRWPEGVLERVEKLEQLRILEHGYTIRVVKTNTLSPGVDTPEDVKKVEKLINQKGNDG